MKELRPDDFPVPETCRYCGAPVKRIYNRKYGFFYVCTKCDSSVGCHKNTVIPLGSIANRELKDARISAHKKLDEIWGSGHITRKKAYRIFAHMMGIKTLHIAWLDLEDVKRLIEILDEYVIREKINDRSEVC